MPAAQGTALYLENITKTFGTHVAVDDVSVRVPTGSVYGFIGPNGAGKTTTLRMVIDIIRPDHGAIEVLGTRNLPEIRSRIGYLPEERGMYKKMRTLEFVSYIGSLKGMSPRAARERGSALMERYGLGRWQTATVDALSKGMQQKLQFISTIVHDPELLILDEPFSGLDPVNVEAIKETILQSRRDGRTVIFSTHMMEHAERLCDALFMIHEGRKVLDGTIQEIKSAHGDRAIHLTCYGASEFIRQLPYVIRMREYGNDLEVFISEETPPQAFLRDIVDRLKISRFDVTEPSLYDIFLEQVAPARRHQIAADGTLISTSPAGQDAPQSATPATQPDDESAAGDRPPPSTPTQGD
ncbi:MAG: ATP-binding cassette domain-containing protein [Candidatus Eisenbacteria sp.]|nr:ATP-binding cassette domain-containing protein [Candidatus Eisenbacteria bacterium]